MVLLKNILMHDIKYNTVNKLDDILRILTSRGYKFGTLNTSSPTASLSKKCKLIH